MKKKGTTVLEGREAAGQPYLRVPTPEGRGAFAVNRLSRQALARVDAVAFDCDGVLIDARRSYDATIKAVVEEMVKELTGTRLRLSKLLPNLLAVIRRTGGFNSDWDSSYALTLFSLVALETSKDRRSSVSDPPTALQDIVEEFGSAPRERGAIAVDNFLRSKFPRLQDRLDKAREQLGYPGRGSESRLASCFDEIYFGGALFQKLHGVPAKNPRRKGLIELERVLVKTGALESIANVVGRGRIVMVTGRPHVGTEYSLGKTLMSYFHRGSSMFIGDADIFPELREEYDRFRKPSPEALIRAAQRLSSKTMLYVGDSGEDVMMVQHARQKGLKGFLFAGVYETSPDPDGQVAFFEREGADVIVETVNLIPSALLLAPKEEGAR
jgi:phosphoglycolate phosphatase-like HAD superfamily hydrolase